MADVCLIIALLLVYQAVGTLSLDGLGSYLASAKSLPVSLEGAALLFVLAAVLKTALLPLHGWLIQVVEAPTPVSALLHAGIINLGGYLLILFAPLFAQATAAQWLVLVVAGLGLVQNWQRRLSSLLGGGGVRSGGDERPILEPLEAVVGDDRQGVLRSDLPRDPPDPSIDVGVVAAMADRGRLNPHVAADDNETLEAFHELTRVEGIMPALETSHALAYAARLAPTMRRDQIIVINLSGRGDKDIFTVAKALGFEM